MWGAIAGDIIGSVYEQAPVRHTAFELFPRRARFTDDTVLTVATAEAILRGTDYGESYLRWGRRFPAAGYGPGFRRWLQAGGLGTPPSLGNGSAMRVSPVGLAFGSVGEVLREARLSAMPSHACPDGIRGAQAVALAVFLARTGGSREEIRGEVSSRFGYDLARTIEEIRPTYRTGLRFDMTCAGSVPEAIIAFLDSPDWEGAVRLAVSLAGDSDTQASIAGAVAEAYYGQVPDAVRCETRLRLPEELADVVNEFTAGLRLGGCNSHCGPIVPP